MVNTQKDKVLRIVSNADIRTSQPHVAYETETWPTSSLFYVGLVRLQDARTPSALAELWTVSDDGTIFTFVLREGIKFSKGRDNAWAGLQRPWSWQAGLTESFKKEERYIRKRYSLQATHNHVMYGLEAAICGYLCR